MSPIPLSADLTSIDTVRASILASSTAMVAHLNADLKGRYLSAFADYVANMESGQIVPPERQVAPKPPNSWELAPPTPDGLVFYQIGTTPVCDMPPLPFYAAGNKPPALIPGTFDIGAEESALAGWFGVGPTDSEPNGFRKTFPSPSGPITVVKVKTPFGSYYEVVS